MQVIVHPSLRPPLAGGAAAAGTIDTEKNVDDDGGGGSSGNGGGGEDGGWVLEGLVEVAAREAVKLGGLEGEAAVNATTLVVARPPLTEEFGEFLGVVEAVNDFLDVSGLRGVVQVRKGGASLTPSCCPSRGGFVLVVDFFSGLFVWGFGRCCFFCAIFEVCIQGVSIDRLI